MNASEPIDLTFFLDTDNSPFVLFDSQGAILYLNDAAEILLAYSNRKELYDLALTYAPRDFGSRTTPIELAYRQLRFHALTVSYAHEEQIGIRFYYRPRSKSNQPLDADRLRPTNINTLLEASIALFSMQSDARLDLFADTDLPECRLDQNRFAKLLRKSLHLLRGATSLHMRLGMTIGETILIGTQHCPIVRLAMVCDGDPISPNDAIESLAESMHIVTVFEADRIVFDIPLLRV